MMRRQSYFIFSWVILAGISLLPVSAAAKLPGVFPLDPEQEAARALAYSLGGGEIDYGALEKEKTILADPEAVVVDLVRNTTDVRARAAVAAYILASSTKNSALRAEMESFLKKLRAENEPVFRQTIDGVVNSVTVPIVEEYLLNRQYGFVPKTAYYSPKTIAVLKARLEDPATPPDERSVIANHIGAKNPGPSKPGASFSWMKMPPTDPYELYDFLMRMIDKLPPDIKDKTKLIRAAKFLQEMIFKDTTGQYPNKTTEANHGLINYYSELNSTPRMGLGSALVYAKLRSAPISQQQPAMWDTTSYPVWSVSLGATHDDRITALRALSTFGHDDCCNRLNWKYVGDRYPTEVSLLNTLWQSSRQSVMNVPASLAGLNIEADLLSEYKALLQRARDLGMPPEFLESHFYAGYYHFYGGVAVATELIAHGFDRQGPIRIPVFFSELLGYFYKMVANTRVYLKRNKDAYELYNAGYKKYRQLAKPPIPASWTRLRYQRAILSLDLALLAVELNVDQHRKGAEWVFRILSK